VTIIYDQVIFPYRYTGDWTRVTTYDGTGLTQTVQGHAVFVRNPMFGPELNGVGSIPYDVVESASVNWTVSGSDTCNTCSPACTITYSGAGSDSYTTGWGSGAQGSNDLGIEEVTNNPAAPKPEPNPWYYSIDVTGDGDNAPQYDITPDHPVCGVIGHGDVSIRYLAIGARGPFPPPADNDRNVVEKSASGFLLEGHRVHTENQETNDDTWHFTGSGSV
jgi:hypothetical protein